MPVEMGMWRIDGDQPQRLKGSTLPSEATLEAYLERDPSLHGRHAFAIPRRPRRCRQGRTGVNHSYGSRWLALG